MNIIMKSPSSQKTIGKIEIVPIETIKNTIAYYYLVSFCPAGQIDEFIHKAILIRKTLAESSNLDEEEFLDVVVPEVCRRIVSFHENSRYPDQERVDNLADLAKHAGDSPEDATLFQQEMAIIARFPQRASSENRLHRKKGCALCHSPCMYGYFTLVSDPQFGRLQDLFSIEMNKPPAEQSPLNPAYAYTIGHLKGITGKNNLFINVEHLANLSYCLMLLGMAKSRMAIPEQQLRLFQAANQEFIHRTHQNIHVG